ncbi:MAG: carbohydrate-binding domain-containing protein [Muribaculaceae bacterium]|nr:carbohydrate-binding domain-containing protein [Muribaculaceae bacterium]
MKKTILSILILAGVMVASAAIYPYLNVGLSSGTETSYPATDGLTLHFENGKLVASNDGTQLGTNNLSDILYMMFGLGAEENPVVAGDVNGDGQVTATDVTLLYNVMLNNDYTGVVNGDQDGDGNITAGDVTFVYNILLGSKGRSLGEITDGYQTMWVVTGDVKWAFTTEQLDTIYYSNGTSFTAQGKTFNIADVDQIYVDNTPVADNTVDVAYSGNTATMIVAGNIAKNMTATVNGAHVVALQDADVTNEIIYTLSGSSTNGSFYQDGELKITVVLNGLTLNNPDGAAINIRDGKRIAVELAEGTTNTLTDGANGDQKGCFAVKGHTEFKGGGILNITGNAKNAFWGKEYVEIKKTVGEINILGAVADGFNINQYYQQNGGKVTIKNVGDDGIQVSYETDDNDQIIEDEENTGEVTLKDGTLDMTISNNNGGKGVKAVSNFIMLKGTFKVVQSGNLVAGDGDVDYGTCVKAGGDILIHGGTIDFTNTAQGGKGLNADGTITIDETNTTTTINIKANGQGGTVEAGSSGSGETPQSYRIYVAKPTSGGGYPGGGGSNAWTNMYLYNSNGTMVANITGNTVQKTSGYSTLTFYYYDFGSADSGTYYLKSDNYTSQGRTYIIQSQTFSGPTSGEDIYYQLGGYSTTSTSSTYTRTYQLNNVTATYGGSSDIGEDTGTSYNAAGIKADGNITVDAGNITIANSGSMSKSFKSKATMTINGGTVTLTPSGAMQVINSDASYSSGIKAVDFVMNGGTLNITSSGVAGKGISTTNITTNGGSITINNSGTAQAAGSTGDYYTAKGFKTDGNLNMLGGTIYIKMTGTGGKGIKVNGNYVQGVSGGEGPTLTVITTGSAAGQSSGGGGFPGGGPGGGGVSGSAKAIKVLGTIVINGGQSEVNTSTDGAEGIESKTSITINGGNHYYKAYDDGMNCTGAIRFLGGVTVVYSNGNDAVDSNKGSSGAIEIGDGCVLAYTSKGSPEEGLDCDNNSYISITGNGYAISGGGSQGGGGGWGGSSGIGNAVQGYYLSTSSLSYSTGRYYTIANSSGTNLITYSVEAGFSSSLSLFTAKGMTKNQSYTIKYSTTAPTDATTAWHGVYLGSSATGTNSFTSFTAN